MDTPDPQKSFLQRHLVPVILIAVVLGLGACLVSGAMGLGWIFRTTSSASERNSAPVVEEPVDQVAYSAGSPELAAAPPETPAEAVLVALHGLVEVSPGDGTWQSAQAGGSLSAGMHIRTGALSRAALVYYDGSLTSLSAQTELVIDQLDARRNAERVVVLSQLTGESEHQVVSSSLAGSRYQVFTPTALGEARGTSFKVKVNDLGSSYFQVSKGLVAVSSVQEGQAAGPQPDSAVLVESGQATLVDPNQPPAQPTYFFTGQGEVTFVGESWVIAGQVLKTHPATVVIGNPQVGDEVFFEGRLQADSSRLVDVIVLLRRSPANRFSLTGVVEKMETELWTVNGQTVAVTDITQVETGIEVGDLVRAEGMIMSDGTLQAEVIIRLEDAPGLPFDFTGVLQETGEEYWTISDIQVTVTVSTTLSEELEVGELVRVQGWILDDGQWQAASIERSLDESRAFEFTGAIESIQPWQVAGISFETRLWTIIEEGLAVGDPVHVRGQVMPDGVWVAHEVRRLDNLTDVRIVLVGRVLSTDPWVVSRITLNVDEDTLISGEIVTGMLVRVEIQVLEDGAWKVLSIEPLGQLDLGQACQEVSAVVVSVSGSQVLLEGWPLLNLGEGAQVLGDLKPNSIVLVQVCLDEEGNPYIVYIYIILQPLVEEPEQPGEMPGEKVMICHKPNSKNPHTIVVSQSAVPAHLGHGDTLGSCR